MRQAKSRSVTSPIVVSILACAFLSAAIAWVLRDALYLNPPIWEVLAAIFGASTIFLIGLLNYDVLVLLSFCLIGFVRNEPAPFDLLLVILLVIGFLKGRLRLANSRYNSIVFLGIWGLVLTNLLSTFDSNLTAYNLRFLGITLYSLCIFLFIRMYAVYPKAILIVLVGYAISAVINALLVELGFLGLELPFSVLAFSTRGVGFFKDANVYGPFLVVAALWILDRIIQTPFKFPRTIFMIGLTILLGTGAILSLSRALWINIIIVFCLYFFFLLRHASRKGFGFLVFGLVFILVVFFVFQYLGLFNAILGHLQIQNYDQVRFNIQREGLIAGLTHPFGVGPGGWPNAHSLYIKTLAEQGIVGLLSLGILIGGVCFPLVQYALKERSRTAVISASMLLAIIIGQLVNSLVIDSIHWRHLWVVLGLAWAFQELHGKKAP